MKKKLFLLIVTCLIAVLSGVACAACTQPQDNHERQEILEAEEKTMLFLGDSIAEAMAGPSPLTERETYGYYGILGNINGYSFYNRAVSGDETRHLLSLIQREDDGVNMVKSLICTADIIHISIMGNDLLGYDLSSMIIEAAQDRYDTADYLLDRAYNNLDRIITTLRELNPGAIIILQTQYNPVGENSPLVSSYAKMRLSSMEYTAHDYHKLAGKIITRLNDTMRRYLRDNQNKFKYEPFYLVDVYSAFEAIYKASPARWNRLFCPDGIHPANEGHAIIAETNQRFLETLGVASTEALENYKELRSAQLTRLYANTVEVSAIKANIMRCETFSDVSLAYFNATEGKDANYRYPKELTSGRHFEDDRFYSIDTLSVRGLDLTEVYIPNVGTTVKVMDTHQSGIAFHADGTYEIKYIVNDGLIETLKKLADWGVFSFPLDLNNLIDVDIQYLQSRFLKHMFPGFDYGNLSSSLELLQETMGLTIEGPDFSTQAMREMANQLADTGHFVLQSFDVLGDTLGITLTGKYRLETLTSELTGETYTAIYLGEYFYTGEPYLRFTYKQEGLSSSIRLTVDVIDLVIEGEEQ